MKVRHAKRAGLGLLATLSLMSSAAAIEQPVHVLLLIDVSASIPWLESEDEAQRVGNDVLRYFPPLRDRSHVTLVVVGEYRKAVIREIQVSTRFRPEVVRQSVVETFRSLPAQVRSGALKPHGETNLVGSLLDAASRANCASEQTVVIAATDGQESSPSFGNMPPKLQKAVFAGCPELHFVGLSGNSPKHTDMLRAAWNNWAKSAGFANFTAQR